MLLLACDKTLRSLTRAAVWQPGKLENLGQPCQPFNCSSSLALKRCFGPALLIPGRAKMQVFSGVH